MPRKAAEPFLRVRGTCRRWIGRINGKEVTLGPAETDEDRRAAFKRFYELVGGASDALTVAEVVDGFLSWHRDFKGSKPGTVTFYDWSLQRYVEKLGNRAIDSVTLVDLESLFRGWQLGPTTRSNVVRALRAVHKYAVDRHGLASNPAAKLEKPQPQSRDIEYSEAFRKQVMDALDTPRARNFRDLLEVLWRTGARPQELRQFTPAQYSAENKWIDIPAKDAKGGREPRIIHLDDECCAILDRYVKTYPGEGPLLRNFQGKAWTRSALGSWCHRLKDRCNLSLTIYGVRHTWARTALRKGVESLYVARMLGHKDLAMLNKVYGNLSRKDGVLKDALKQING